MLTHKISKSLYCINRVKNFVDQKSLRTMYFAMIHSFMAYGTNIYGCATKTNLEKFVWPKKKQFEQSLKQVIVPIRPNSSQN
jgi:hypothetical protein